MANKDPSNSENLSDLRVRHGEFGAPKAVGPQVPIDPENPKPPGLRPDEQVVPKTKPSTTST